MTAKPPVFQPSQITLGDEFFHLHYFNGPDLDEIVSIEKRSHPNPWSEKNFQSSLSSHHCVGLRYHNKWVAYAVVSFVVGEAELLLFVVDKTWQGKRLASVFLRELVKQASCSAQSMFLEVRQSNRAAIRLYDAVGFHEVGVRPNYYPTKSGGKEDAILMALDMGLD